MKLMRNSGQSRYTFHEEFEADESAGEGKQIAFAAMRRLLDELDAADGPSLFVYTSLFRVCFVADDDFRLPTITRCAPYYHTTESGENVAAFQIAIAHEPAEIPARHTGDCPYTRSPAFNCAEPTASRMSPARLCDATNSSSQRPSRTERLRLLIVDHLRC